METVMEKTLVHTDLDSTQLIDLAVKNNEGTLAKNQALCVKTGSRTGRSPKDRFIVKDPLTADTIDWGKINQPFGLDDFNRLWEKCQAYIQKKPHYITHARVGADPEHFLPVHVTTETAWHSLFARNLFIPSTKSEFDGGKSHWQILSVPSFKTNPADDNCHSDGAVILNLSERKILLAGMQYAGEMKKAMFSAMNYILPPADVLPMHCAANMDDTGNVALFFGLSGTGKTTLSADPERKLIGDDEHGWSSTGVFNFEGGCYAKCINLSREKEPIIWDAIRKGTIIENVVLDAALVPNYDDGSLSLNSRAGYPRSHIANCVDKNSGGHPNAVIFLTCDMHGVLPPISILTKEQAAYHFLSGYTALVGSTEVGSSHGITPTFSACFGAPFFPRAASVYAELLMKRIDETGAKVFLVNTGWTGGRYGEGGTRFDIPVTRAIVKAILTGQVNDVETTVITHFDLKVPVSLPNIDSHILTPEKTWEDKVAYRNAEKELVRQFIENFKQFNVSTAIRNAGPIEKAGPKEE